MTKEKTDKESVENPENSAEKSLEEKAAEKFHWHPAFYAVMKIELCEDMDCLDFMQEVELGTEPVRTDLMIIKKEGNRILQKSIGKIFRRYNVVEYKSPDKSLSIDAFYKACGYVCFYKALNGKEDEIAIEEITLTLVCSHYPRRLIKHLKERGYGVKERFQGIYYVTGYIIPIQIVLNRRLPEADSLWLASLDNHITDQKRVDKLVSSYAGHMEDPIYRMIMNLIIKANWKVFRREKDEMCEALMELFEEEINAKVQEELKNLQAKVKKEADAKVQEELKNLQVEVKKEANAKVQEKCSRELADAICQILGEYGEIPAGLKDRIVGQTDMSCLIQWMSLAARSGSIEGFAQGIAAK